MVPVDDLLEVHAEVLHDQVDLLSYLQHLQQPCHVGHGIEPAVQRDLLLVAELRGLGVDMQFELLECHQPTRAQLPALVYFTE